jgi:aspartyl-tRNA(Asn)/glutamyl-tRNA(Gln) amidotransferase subunit A
MLENFKPPYNSTLIERLLESGMSSLGKVNMDEFAMGSTT